MNHDTTTQHDELHSPEQETVLAASADIQPSPLDDRNAESGALTPTERPLLRLVAGEEEEAPSSQTVDSEQDVYKFPVDAADRRKHRRFRVSRPGKVLRRATQQFQSVTSKDLSYSGALLSVATRTPIEVGEIIDVGLALTKSSLIPTKALVQGVVVRASAIEHGRQDVAVRYIQPSTLQKAA